MLENCLPLSEHALTILLLLLLFFCFTNEYQRFVSARNSIIHRNLRTRTVLDGGKQHHAISSHRYRNYSKLTDMIHHYLCLAIQRKKLDNILLQHATNIKKIRNGINIHFIIIYHLVPLHDYRAVLDRILRCSSSLQCFVVMLDLNHHNIQ